LEDAVTVKLDMPPDSLILIAEHADLLFEALRSYVLKIVPDAGIVRIRGLGQLLEQADRAAEYALIVLDADLPGLAVLPSIDELLQTLGRSPLVLLASEFRKDDVTRALERGVNAYLPKSMPGPVIIAGLGLALCGQFYVPPHSRLSPSQVDPASGREVVPVDGSAVAAKNITRRQLEILELLAEGKTNSEIANMLGLAESTVRLHLRAAYRRLGVRNRTQAVRETLRLFPGIT
jgi:two-component system nitrate/nitrite response regulator NarL